MKGKCLKQQYLNVRLCGQDFAERFIHMILHACQNYTNDSIWIFLSIMEDRKDRATQSSEQSKGYYISYFSVALTKHYNQSN